MQTTSNTSETLAEPVSPSPDAALATPPESAAVATEPPPVTKARKPAKRGTSGSKAAEGADTPKPATKPAKSTKAKSAAKAEPDAEATPETRTTPAKGTGSKPAAKAAKESSKAKRAATPEPVEPATPTKPATRTAPSSMPRSKPGTAATPEKPWLAKVSNATLANAATGFLAAIEAEGASEATIAGYRRELAVAMAHFGEGKLLALIQPHEVQRFYECPAVMVARDGSPKAKPSFDRTRRVLRLALCWAVEQGLIESAPLPDAE